MMGSVSANRRAHALARALDAFLADEEGAARAPKARPEAPVPGVEQSPLLSVAERLTALPRPTLSTEVRTEQRARLVAAMRSSGPSSVASHNTPASEEYPTGDRVPAQRRAFGSRGTHRALPLDRLRPKSRLSKGLAAGGLTMGVAAGAFGGVAAASSDALPGDTLYGLKRGMEDLRLDLAGSDTSRGKVYLDHASTRLHEARRLLERRRTGLLDADQLAEIRRTLASMRDDASAAHRLLSSAYQAEGTLDPIHSLSTFARNHRATWQELRAQLPPELQDVSQEVTSVFDAMDNEVAPIQPLLPYGRGETTPSTTPEGSANPPNTPRGRPRISATAPESPAAGPTASEVGGGQTRPEDFDGRGSLLEQGTGLLGPAQDITHEDGDIATQPEAPHGRVPQPDLTVPPLLEDLMPRFGLNVRRNED